MTALAAPPPPPQSNYAAASRSLDLRAPSTFASATAQGYGRFSGLQRPRGGEDFSATPSAAARPARIPGSVEAFAQRFRHEGLPVARLWENRSALVSLGLNSKGKPGIWLVQKTH